MEEAEEQKLSGDVQSCKDFIAMVSFEGKALGYLKIPAGNYCEVEIVPNPLQGKGHDPRMEWFDLNVYSKQNGLRSRIEDVIKRAIEEKLINTKPEVQQVKVGLPVSHISGPLQSIKKYHKKLGQRAPNS